MTKDRLIALLGLEPLEPEGGFFRETYRAADTIPAECLAGRYSGDRAFATAIYYLLTPGEVSKMHRLVSDEVFHFLLGGPVTMLQLHPGGRSETITLGPDIEQGQRLQVIVPRGVWQGCLLEPGTEYALMGVTVAPGFEYADYEHGDRDTLIAGWPDTRELIERLT